MKEKIRDNGEKIKQNKVLPYLVGNVVEVSLSPATHEMYSDKTRFWIWTQREKRMEQTEIWIPCVKENVLSSRHLHGRQYSCPSLV